MDLMAATLISLGSIAATLIVIGLALCLPPIIEDLRQARRYRKAAPHHWQPSKPSQAVQAMLPEIAVKAEPSSPQETEPLQISDNPLTLWLNSPRGRAALDDRLDTKQTKAVRVITTKLGNPNAGSARPAIRATRKLQS